MGRIIQICKRLLKPGAAALLLALLGSAAVAQKPAAEIQADETAVAAAKIDVFHSNLIALMKDDTIDFEARTARIKPAVEELFHLQAIARISAGKFWRDFSDEERDSYLGTLTRLLMANYASRFKGFSGQRFETLETSIPRQRQVLVKTHIINDDGSSVPIHYFFREGKVFNVVADGISDLSLRRAEYTAILSKSGLAELLVKMQRNIDTLSKK